MTDNVIEFRWLRIAATPRGEKISFFRCPPGGAARVQVYALTESRMRLLNAALLLITHSCGCIIPLSGGGLEFTISATKTRPPTWDELIEEEA